jgi:hypothetical protein
MAVSIKLFLPRSEAKNFFIQGWTNVRSAAHTRTDLPVGATRITTGGRERSSFSARLDRSVLCRGGGLCWPRSPVDARLLRRRQAIEKLPGGGTSVCGRAKIRVLAAYS